MYDHTSGEEVRRVDNEWISQREQEEVCDPPWTFGHATSELQEAYQLSRGFGLLIATSCIPPRCHALPSASFLRG